MNLYDRKVTGWINWCIDSLLPVFIRDSRLFMSPLLRLALGSAWGEFARFKEQANSLTPSEIEAVYRRLSSSHLKRETDLHPACTHRILERVIGPMVLDVGCGRGVLLRLLTNEPVTQVVGLDILPPQGDFPEAVSLCSGRANSLPFADRSFDTVICAHTLEHTIDPQMVVRELRRVARQRLIIIVPRQRAYRYTFDLHLHFYPYPHSLALLVGTKTNNVRIVGGDLYYEEDL